LPRLGVGHGGHHQVISATVQRGEQPFERGVSHVDLDAEDLTERGGQVGVEADDGLVVRAEGLERRVERLGADLDDTGLLDLGRQSLLQGRVRLRRRHRCFGLWLLAGLTASRDGERHGHRNRGCGG
jgi:hypothetical protein